jgi:transcriptional regulator with XRE-family HTH domain
MTRMAFTMPAKSPISTDAVASSLHALGEGLRARRKALRLSAVTVAQASSMSRVTLHRLERGEAAVTIGSYMNVAEALGLRLGLVPSDAPAPTVADTKDWIPSRVRLDDYPQLRRLAWQVSGVNELTPIEAWGFYERNERHVERDAIEPREQDLIDALRLAFGKNGV